MSPYHLILFALFAWCVVVLAHAVWRDRHLARRRFIFQTNDNILLAAVFNAKTTKELEAAIGVVNAALADFDARLAGNVDARSGAASLAPITCGPRQMPT